MTGRTTTRWSATLALTASLLMGAAGCNPLNWRPGMLVSKLDVPDGVPWRSDARRRGDPVRIVATWTDTVLHQPGAPAQRGFGGRLYFYDRKGKKPIAVEGQLVVYAFDELNRKPTDNKPDKRFVFPPGQFALHESQSEIGTSYSVWLPWDAVGGFQTDVSLIARFEPTKGGGLVVSEQTRQRLPGQMRETPETMLAGPAGSGVQQASSREKPEGAVTTADFREGASAPKPPKAERGALKTTTIALPSAPQGAPGVRTTVRMLTPGESVRR